MSLVKGSPEHNFFLENPELKYISVFKKLLEEYPEKEASKIMWSIFLYEDPDSKFYRIPKELRLKEIQDNYYKFKPEEFKEVIRSYTTLILTKEENLYKIQMDKLDEITVFLRDLSLDDGEQFKKSMQIMGKLSKIWTDLEVIKNRLIEVQNKTNIKGGAKESMREKRK
jgi:hypothetical protein